MSDAYLDAQRHFDSCDLSDALARVQPPPEPSSSCSPCCLTPLQGDLLKERDRVLAIAKVALDVSDETHVRIMLSLFAELTGEALEASQIVGPHWERIGFQGDKPATDLRGAGMLGVLHALFLARMRPEVCCDAVAYRPEGSGTEFPLMVISLNMTQLVLTALRSGALDRVLRSRKTGSVNGTACTLYAALMVDCWTQWKARGLGVENFSKLKDDLAILVQRRPSKLLRTFEREQRTRKPPSEPRTKSIDSDIANPDKIELRELV